MLLINVIEHYRDNHEKCHESSRCRNDPNYEPQRLMLTDNVSQKLLRGVIINSTLYKNASDFVYEKDTYYVESFNNTIDMFQDKRISFTDDAYRMRS